MGKDIPPIKTSVSKHMEPPMDPAISRELETSKMNVNDVVQKPHLMQPHLSSGKSLKGHATHIDSKNKLAKQVTSVVSERSQELGFHTVIGKKGKTR